MSVSTTKRDGQVIRDDLLKGKGKLMDVRERSLFKKIKRSTRSEPLAEILIKNERNGVTT